ncbi:MAG: methylthioribulose 1-phosphate dehydratase [Planctomycetaceae bacterium]|nr:methylthioribulose 1-phosphate dehydratase [Planctomycetaceae bacterium]
MNDLTPVHNIGEYIAAGDTRAALRVIGREFHSRCWSLGTSSNYSVITRREPIELLITASGKDKSSLTDNDFVSVDAAGNLLNRNSTGKQGNSSRSSAETLLHCLIAECVPDAGAILHTHSVWGTTLSRRALQPNQSLGTLRIEGYEMLKGLEGIKTHESTVDVPVFQNSQDMTELSVRIRKVLQPFSGSESESRPLHGFLLAGHGLYTWGKSLAEARRHIEIFEFLFEVTAQQKILSLCP